MPQLGDRVRVRTMCHTQMVLVEARVARSRLTALLCVHSLNQY